MNASRFVIGILRKMCKLYDKYQQAEIFLKLHSIGVNPSFSFPMYTYGLEHVTIGDNFCTGERLKLRTFDSWEGRSYSPQIKIGNNVTLQSDCHISAIDRVEIGDNVLMASFVYISDHSHGHIVAEELNMPPLKRPLYSKGPILIGNNVWIGEKVCILPNVSIGESAIIGAGSVVTKDIPPHAVAVGNPARVIKHL
jgi:serine acetyltransferase